jgi:hypothetical protein
MLYDWFYSGLICETMVELVQGDSLCAPCHTSNRTFRVVSFVRTWPHNPPTSLCTSGWDQDRGVTEHTFTAAMSHTHGKEGIAM